MLQPISLRVENFKTFPYFEFEFPKEQGLYFVAGRNDAHPELEGNACGKSTLFCDAPVWCLYGKTPRGLKASDVVNWSAKSCKVEFTFRVKDKTYCIRRTQNPNSLQLSIDQKPFQVAVQTEINQQLGLDYDAFCFSVVFAQFTSMFFDLKPSEKAEIMESVLPLEVWDQASGAAKRKVEAIEQEINKKLQQSAEIKGRVSAIMGVIEQTELKIDEWEQSRQDEIDLIKLNLRDLDNKKAEFQLKGRKLVTKEAELQASLTEASAIFSEFKNLQAEIAAEMVKLSSQSTSLSSEAASIQQELTRLSKLGDICTVCKQVIDGLHLKTEQQRHTTRLGDISKALEGLKLQYQHVKAEADIRANDVIETQNVVEGIKSELSVVTRDISVIKHSLLSNKDQISRFNRDLTQWQTKPNPFIDQKAKLESDKKELSKKIIQFQGKIVELQSQVEHTRFWITGFKEVKLMLINDVLAQLELEVNNYLYQFGLHGWKIEFASEATTKTGKTKKSFTVMIHAPTVTSPVPWEAWSGGETQRLRLAGALGMADLILTCFGMSPGMEIFDEPSQFLSQRGVSDLVSSLRDRALTTGRLIFLIDHRNLDTSQFSGQYTVVREPKSVRLLTH